MFAIKGRLRLVREGITININKVQNLALKSLISILLALHLMNTVFSRPQDSDVTCKIRKTDLNGREKGWSCCTSVMYQ